MVYGEFNRIAVFRSVKVGRVGLGQVSLWRIVHGTKRIQEWAWRVCLIDSCVLFRWDCWCSEEASASHSRPGHLPRFWSHNWFHIHLQTTQQPLVSWLVIQ